MAVAEVVRGPDTASRPAPGAWLLTGRPAAGAQVHHPGFLWGYLPDQARSAGVSGAGLVAEIISTKILHAIGYHVPENYVIDLDPARLDIAPGATFRTHRGDERPIQRARTWNIGLKDQIRNPDGTVRAVASRFVPGTPVGQHRYYGTRRDDPNDIYPHEYHRQLRALRVFAAWLNHDDTKALNSFDAYVEDEGRRYIRHYLLDFGATLGSGSTHSKRPKAGYEYYVEGNKILKGIFTFGFWERPWTKAVYPDYPSVGRYEAGFFEPGCGNRSIQIPAFDRMDAADAFWGARIVSGFTNEMIPPISDGATSRSCASFDR